MWKHVSQSNRRWSWLLVWFTILVGCSDQTSAILVPTVPLLPPTATATSIVPTSTPTSQPPPAAVDIMGTSTAGETDAVSVTPLIETDITLPESLMSDMAKNLAQRLSVTPNVVQLARITSVQWFDLDLGCTDRLSFDEHGSGYEVEFLVGGVVYRYRVALPDMVNLLCSGSKPARDQLLVLVDPSAEEFFSLAQQRVARQLDLPLRRVRLAELEAVTWMDTSLGCPQTGNTYDPAQIQGYRMVLLAGDNQYTFHTDSISIFACNAPDVSIVNG